MVFGYAYPAYECYKTVELNKPEVEQLRFWCQYWILVAVLTVCERIGDTFISWVPMYSEAKLAFYIYLWYPKTKGTSYVYDSFFRPYIAKHENEIDRSLLELRTRAGDTAFVYWQRAASYGQTRVFEILQYIAAQSTTRPRTAQLGSSVELKFELLSFKNLAYKPQQQGPRARQPSAPSRQPSTNHQPARTQAEPDEPLSPTSSSQHQMEVAEVACPSKALEAAGPATASNGHTAPEVSSQPKPTEEEAMKTEDVPSSSANENENKKQR
ncbi:hypothetical protein OIU84_013791 [Salix udensis]|uniref:HVA22-like protein n=1 Tax=Salix udensis TaxID=889485 RepID=A0AAD6JIP5_9ROSI|nr:hypothetical protein OIU84_013791 [Salix udensis]